MVFSTTLLTRGKLKVGSALSPFLLTRNKKLVIITVIYQSFIDSMSLPLRQLKERESLKRMNSLSVTAKHVIVIMDTHQKLHHIAPKARFCVRTR